MCVFTIFLPVLEVEDRRTKSGSLKIPGSWVSACQYVGVIIVTRHSSTPLRQCEVPKLCLFVGGERRVNRFFF